MMIFWLMATAQSCSRLTIFFQSIEKPGLCPYAPPQIFGCVETFQPKCLSDADCEGAAKCCAISAANCGKQECVADLLKDVIKPGSCPPNVGWGEPGYRPVVCDMFSCDMDAHCGGNGKCCPNSCGSTECI